MSFVVRPVSANDSEALRAIYNHAVHHTTATMDTEDRSAEEQNSWITVHDGEPYTGIVAVTTGDSGELVVGYASLSPFNRKPGYSATVENSIYVHPDWWGKGVGRLLLTALVEAAGANGFRNIIALISADNEPSLRLHRSLGFKDVGLLAGVGHKHGKSVDVSYLQLVVGDKP